MIIQVNKKEKDNNNNNNNNKNINYNIARKITCRNMPGGAEMYSPKFTISIALLSAAQI
jgi:hypothetical protein